MEQRVIRTRRKPAENLVEGAKQHIAETLQSYAELRREIDILQAKAAEMEESMYAEMKKFDIEKVVTDTAMAERFTPMGKKVNIIDPQKYHKLVSAQEFFASIKVSNTEAKKYLSGKELEKITTVIPPEPKQETIKITLAE